MKKIFTILLLLCISNSLKAQDDPDLLGTWYLYYFESNGTTTQAPPLIINPLRIIFSSTASMSPAVNGNSTCNGFFYDYQVDIPNATIRTINFGQTLGNCGPDTFEPLYMNILGGDDTFNYNIDSQTETLTMTDQQGGKIVYGRNSLSVENQKVFSKTVQLFPNPTQKQLFIKGITRTTKSSYTVFNVIGNVVITEKLLPKNYIDVQSLKAGVYFLKIVHDNKTVIKKFIKK